eukprot:4107067-Prymnesium_polylepis.1
MPDAPAPLMRRIKGQGVIFQDASGSVHQRVPTLPTRSTLRENNENHNKQSSAVAASNKMKTPKPKRAGPHPMSDRYEVCAETNHTQVPPVLTSPSASLQNIRTADVPVNLTYHGEQRAEERRVAAHVIQRAMKHGKRYTQPGRDGGVVRVVEHVEEGRTKGHVVVVDMRPTVITVKPQVSNPIGATTIDPVDQ